MARKDENTVATVFYVTACMDGTITGRYFENMKDAISYVQYANKEGHATLYVNGWLMPDILKDETFFYASVKAAKDGKVWNEYVHGFTTKTALSYMESDCLCEEDWKQVRKDFIENVRKDISGEVPVTCDEVPDELGVARVNDKDLADLCEENGFDVLPCGTGEFNEDGECDEFWLIFEHGGEDEYFEDIYEDESDEEPILVEEEGINWVYVPETRESVFESPMLHAIWDAYEGEGVIYFGKPSRLYGGFKIDDYVSGITAFSQVEAVINTYLDDPDDIEVRDGVIYRRLKKMPFDVASSDGSHLVHATGWEYLDKCGTRWIIELEEE